MIHGKQFFRFKSLRKGCIYSRFLRHCEGDSPKQSIKIQSKQHAQVTATTYSSNGSNLSE